VWKIQVRSFYQIGRGRKEAKKVENKVEDGE
jgi:hypothetical protein